MKKLNKEHKHTPLSNLIFKSFLYSCILVLSAAALNAQSIEATLVSTWDDPEIVGSSLYNNRYNEIWGYAAFGHEWAILGSTEGTHFIDVTDPAQPVQKYFVPGKATGPQIVHRDYHDYKGYLYAVSDEGSSSLQIIDMRMLPGPIDVIYDDNTMITRAHNIFIDTSSAVLYSLATIGSTGGFRAMSTFDLTNPRAPKFIRSFNSFEGYSISHVHDAVVWKDTAYLNCGNNGLVIADFTNPLSPEVLSILKSSDYPQSGYNHSGWLSEDRQYYYMADETHGMDIKVFDVSNVREPELVSTFNAGSPASQSIAHNLIAHCDQLHVSYYYDGYQVFDISDPSEISKTHYYPTSQEQHGFSYKGAWGVYPFLPSGTSLVSDMQNGLFIFSDVIGECEETTTGSKTTAIIENGILILPNPVHLSDATISLRSIDDSAIETISFSTIGGQLIQSIKLTIGQQQANEIKISLFDAIQPGIYIAAIQTEKRIHVQKLLVLE